MGINEKLFAIMDASQAIEKNMSIKFKTFEYKGVSESSVLNEVKKLLKTHRVIVYPINVIENRNDMLTRLVVTWEFADVDTGETKIVVSAGHGADTQDKGAGKAMTYAYKVMLQKTFMLFSGDDTDATHSEELTFEQEEHAKALKASKVAEKQKSAQGQTGNGSAKPKQEAEVPVDLNLNNLNSTEKQKLETLKTLFAQIEEKAQRAVFQIYKIEKIENLPMAQWEKAISGMRARIEKNAKK